MAVVKLTSLSPVPGVGTKVAVDGVDITNQIRSLSFTMAVGDLVTMEVEYACIETVTYEGHAQVLHLCPLGGEHAYRTE